jgi:hypothetical protein
VAGQPEGVTDQNAAEAVRDESAGDAPVTTKVQ